MNIKLVNGDSADELKKIPDNSIDSIVCDPPAWVSFMGRDFDKAKDRQDAIEKMSPIFSECLRVIKPGGHALVWALPRTSHYTMCAIEDSGWEIRDVVVHIFGTGFPKSHNISKAIDKIGAKNVLETKKKLIKIFEKSGISKKELNDGCGFNACGYLRTTSEKPDPWVNTLPSQKKWEIMADVMGVDKSLMDFSSFERKIIGKKVSGCFSNEDRHTIGASKAQEVDIDISTHEISKKYEGFGTAMKPSHECWILCRKPVEGTIAQNVLKYGTGGLNIDECRIPYENTKNPATNPKYRAENGYKIPEKGKTSDGAVSFTSSKNDINTSGRFPSHTIFSHHPDCYGGCVEECPVKELDSQAPYVGSLYSAERKKDTSGGTGASYLVEHKKGESNGAYDAPSGASKMFKTIDSKKFESFKKTGFIYQSKATSRERDMGLDEEKRNTHPTLKSINLMRYLIRLITPKNGIVLDPYMGSGSTGCAALLEGMKFIGIEKEEEYYDIAVSRIKYIEEKNNE